jgi:hypothetical protein
MTILPKARSKTKQSGMGHDDKDLERVSLDRKENMMVQTQDEVVP